MHTTPTEVQARCGPTSRQEVIYNWYLPGKGKLILPVECHWIYQRYSKPGSMIMRPTKKWTPCSCSFVCLFLFIFVCCFFLSVCICVYVCVFRLFISFSFVWAFILSHWSISVCFDFNFCVFMRERRQCWMGRELGKNLRGDGKKRNKIKLYWYTV